MQDDQLGWGEAKKQWVTYVKSLAAGDPKRRLCGFDMEEGCGLLIVSADFHQKKCRNCPFALLQFHEGSHDELTGNRWTIARGMGGGYRWKGWPTYM